MMTKLDEARKQLEVFQICDSTFPIGSFNHSYGMETYLREETMTDAEAFGEWLKIYLMTQFKYGEGLVIRLCHESLAKNQIQDIWDYDERLTVSSVAQETRDGQKMIAKQMIQLILDLYDVPLLDEYRQRILDGDSYGNPAIVFAIFTWSRSLEVDESIMYYGYSVLSTMVQNAVRAIPIGQKSGQIALKEALKVLEVMTDKIQSLDAADLGANMPGVELSQMKHETQAFRLFMS